MTPERLAELKAIPCPGWPTIPHVARVAMRELILEVEAERLRLDTLAKLRPGELFDALSDPTGIRAALDRLIAAREKGAAR
jgi:hypothetical protein